MASAAPANLPLFYKDLVPISQQEHGAWRLRTLDSAPFVINEHAVPLTIDEFAMAQRFYPIVFTAHENPVPIALMSLNEGSNTMFGEDGKMLFDAYLPAYIRRYPYMLAKLRPDSEEMSLCIDPTAGAIGDFEEGEAIFDGSEPTDAVKQLLGFCETFEQAVQRTAAFMTELAEHDLLMDGEMSIAREEGGTPYTYRGFRMVSEEKLRGLRGDVLRKMMQSGMLPLIHAHLFSLGLMREVFGRQIAQGKLPEAQPA